METRTRTRMPLTARAAQGLPPPRRKMDRSKQRTYGKQGYTAASRALLKENYIDENDLEEDLVRLNIDDPPAPESSNRDSQETTTTKEQKVKSRAAFLRLVQKHQKGVLNDPKFLEYIQPLLVEAGTKAVVDFKAWANLLSKKFKVVKLAEGSYGEVYKLCEKSVSAGTTAAPLLAAHGGCIFKIVPLHAVSGPGSKDDTATSIAAIVREIKLLKTMDRIPGFTRFRAVHVVQGAYPDSFIEAFRDYKEEGKDCSSKDPQCFPSKQLFAVIEMDDAGKDLDSLKDPSVFQVHDIFWSIVILLANAEEEVEFEHRDLHVGNICIKPCIVGGTTDIPNELVASMSTAPAPLLGLSGLRSTIIDYTLSRAACGPDKTDIIYDPLGDASIFTGHGEGLEDTRQYNAYRHMNTFMRAAHLADRGTDSKNTELWARFIPKTNVIWLSYVLYVLLLRADEAIVPGSCEVAEALQVQMYSTLEEAMTLLDVQSLKKLPSSARELLGVAEAKGWLTGEDVRGFKEQLEKES